MSSSLPGWLRKGQSSDSSDDSASSSSPTSSTPRLLASEEVDSEGYVSDNSSSDEETSRRRMMDSEGILSQLPQAARRLPAAIRAGEIQEAVSNNRVVCVLGNTGCGKSTVIPFILSGESSSVKILCTQPRRMAAISLCEHVQTRFFNQRNHEAVGYRVRGNRTDSEQARIVYVTAGYLKTMLTHDPSQLSAFTHLILDEVHERGIDSDFLSLIVKRLLGHPENEGIKLIVMSATLESDLFVDYFSSLNIGGGSEKPVTVNLTISHGEDTNSSLNRIQEISLDDMYPEFNFAETVLRSFSSPTSPQTTGAGSFVIPGELSEGAQNLAVEIALASSKNHFATLIFLPGLGEIYSTHDKLVDALERRNELLVPADVPDVADHLEASSRKHHYRIFILHSAMPYEEQKMALREPALTARHIVLCTNVAESSLTVPNVDVVIDSGLRRANSYDAVNSVYRLTTVWCSKASCLQRRGRTGRVCNGKYFQLFPRLWFQHQMSAYDAPEVLLSDLSSVFLNAKYISDFWRLPESGNRVVRPSEILCELITPPTQRNVKAAVQDLYEAGILRHKPDEMSELSLLGTLATRLHVEPQIARVLYFSWLAGMPCEGIILAAACGIETDVIRCSSTKYHPGNEEQYCRSIGSYMWYRAGYDLGSFSEPIAVRNLLWSWLAYHYDLKKTGEAPEFHKNAVYAKEFDNFKRSVASICVQFASWIQEEIGDESAGGETDMLKEMLNARSNSALTGACGEELLRRVFKCGRNFDKLKALLVIATNNRLLTADAVGSAAEYNYDPNHSLRFEKLSEQVFVGCSGSVEEKHRFERMSEVSVKLTGRRPESVFMVDRASDQAVNTNWIVYPGRDLSQMSSEEIGAVKREDAVEFQRIKDDIHITVNEGSEFFGLVMPVAVRTCIQVFDRRYTTSLAVGDRGEKIRVKCPKYVNALNWGRITTHNRSNEDFLLTPTLEWLAITVNARSPVGWLQKIPPNLRMSSTDRFWAVAGKITGTSKSVFDEVLPTEARAQNVTILPVSRGGRVGIALLLAALPFPEGLVAQVAISDLGQYEVVKVKLQGRFFDLNRCQKYPLTLRMLRAVSAVRRLISKAIDIPGTCIRRRLVDAPADDGVKLRITEEAMKKVLEIQQSNGENNHNISLNSAIENLLAATLSETATSLDLFPPGTMSSERRVMLIPNSGGASYGEISLDPTIWTEPDERSSHPPFSVFRKDQIADIISRLIPAAAELVSEKDKQEAPIIRLAALGFSVEDISRFSERKAKFVHARKPMDHRIMDPDLNEDELFAAPDWIGNTPLRPHNESLNDDLLSALEIQRILDIPDINVLPKRPPPPLPGDKEEAENETFSNWDHVTVRKKQNVSVPSQSSSSGQSAVVSRNRFDAFVTSPERTQTEVPRVESSYNTDNVVPKPLNKSQTFLQCIWSEIEREILLPSCGNEYTYKQKLANIWKSIELVSNSQDI